MQQWEQLARHFKQEKLAIYLTCKDPKLLRQGFCRLCCCRCLESECFERRCDSLVISSVNLQAGSCDRDHDYPVAVENVNHYLGNICPKTWESVGQDTRLCPLAQ